MPTPVERQAIRRLIFAFAPGLALTVLRTVTDFVTGNHYDLFPKWLWTTLYVIAMCIMLGVLFHWIFIDPVGGTRAHSVGRGACDSCGYDLSGLPDSGACPECGSSHEGGTSSDSTQADLSPLSFLSQHSREVIVVLISFLPALLLLCIWSIDMLTSQALLSQLPVPVWIGFIVVAVIAPVAAIFLPTAKR